MAVTSYTRLFSEQDWARLKEELGLPPRQADVLRCVLDGMPDKLIADATGISVSTVRTHLRRLFEKFGSNDRVELILCMFGYLRKYQRQDGAASASGASAATAARPSARRHAGPNEDWK
jgi:DNA-binding CsgD family transcriptional regulator